MMLMIHGTSLIWIKKELLDSGYVSDYKINVKSSRC
jgi:hypothetical protein